LVSLVEQAAANADQAQVGNLKEHVPMQRTRVYFGHGLVVDETASPGRGHKDGQETPRVVSTTRPPRPPGPNARLSTSSSIGHGRDEPLSEWPAY
jgi:hypothetical protein